VNRQQRRLKARMEDRVIPPVPVNARGEVLGLNLAEIRTAACAARIMNAANIRLAAIYPEDTNPETMGYMREADEHLGTCLRTAEAANIPADSVLLLPVETLKIVLATMGTARHTHDHYAETVTGQHADAPDFGTIYRVVSGEEMPPLADLTALETKVLRIADVLRGEEGVPA